MAAPKLNYMSIARARLGLEGLLDGDSAGDGGTNHGVVAHADETHHVDVRRHGGRTGELGVGVHTAHGVGHAVRGRAGAHVVRVQGAASAATRSDGEVLLASLDALLLVGASDGVLEARGVGGVTGDRDVDVLVPHDGNALADVVGAVAVNGSAGTIGRLPVHVRLILDEFANIGQIPNFDKLIATIRSREISASIILQSQSQLKTIYKDAADTIVGNCDSTLFLGGKEKSTLKEISELLGKETIDLYNQSENRGSQVSHGLSYQKLGKELMTQDELAVMDGGKCIFMLRGVRPFLSDKYDLTRHPNYRYTADADPKNVFDMERYMKKQRAVVKPTDTFDVYEIDATT